MSPQQKDSRVMSYFDRTVISIAGPQIMAEFGITLTEMGSIYSAFIFGYFLFMIPAGELVDRLGPRVTLGLMGFGAALFTGLTALGGRPGLGTYLISARISAFCQCSTPEPTHTAHVPQLLRASSIASCHGSPGTRRHAANQG